MEKAKVSALRTRLRDAKFKAEKHENETKNRDLETEAEIVLIETEIKDLEPFNNLREKSCDW